MSMKMKFEVVGKGKVVAVRVYVSEKWITFHGIKSETYFKRVKTYRSPSRHINLLTWLGKNCVHYDEPGEKGPATPKQKPLPIITPGAMVLGVAKQLEKKGYIVHRKGTTIPLTKCSLIVKDGSGKYVETGCGQQSLVGGYKHVPVPKFVGVCYHRYNDKSTCEIVKVWDEDKARAWLKASGKVIVPPTPPVEAAA